MTATSDFQNDAENFVLCWLATIGADGFPSVSPKEMWTVANETTLQIADIASASSVRNIRENNKVCVSFVDVFSQKGYKLTGRAKLIANSDPVFNIKARDLLQLCGGFKIRNLIEVRVDRKVPILAPSYHVNPDVKEEDLRASAFLLYGVRPAEKVAPYT